MTQTLTAIVGGVEYVINNGTLAWLEGQSGIGMAPSHLITERGPLQHGVSYIGYRLDERTIQLALGFQAVDMATLETARSTLLALFKANAAAMALRWTLNNGKVRQIDCVYAGSMDMPTSDREGFYQKTGVSFLAPNPTFYNPSGEAVSFGLAGGSAAMQIPLVIPWNVGQSTLSQSATVTYTGTAPAYPILTIVGPITSCLITNTTTNEVLSFSGVTIAAGNTYTVDCRYGYKTIVNQSGTNKLADLTDGSDLATFHLAEAIDGTSTRNNSFTVTGTSVTAATAVYIQYYTRYVGM